MGGGGALAGAKDGGERHGSINLAIKNVATCCPIQPGPGNALPRRIQRQGVRGSGLHVDEMKYIKKGG